MAQIITSFHQYIGVRGVVSSVVITTLCAMLLSGQPVPNEFYNVVMLVLGYYFARTSNIVENGKK